MNPVFSIIIPIFNAEKTLIRTLESIKKQGLSIEDYEIILVNDGSTDNSLQLCEDFCRENRNCKIIDQRNQGVSSARNNGIKNAQGTFLCFLDSDDTLVNNSLAYIKDNFPIQDYDLIRFWTKLIYNEQEESKICEGQIVDRTDGHAFIEKNGLETLCVTYLYKIEYIKKTGILFEPLTLGEDYLFISSVLLTNPTILSTSCRIYNYIIREGSATTTRTTEHAMRVIDSQIKANEILHNKLLDLQLQKTRICLYNRALSCMRDKMFIIFSRLLSSEIPPNITKSYLTRCSRITMLPIPLKNIRGFKLLLCLFINIVYYLPVLITPSRFFYKNLFLKYVFPRINRDK